MSDSASNGGEKAPDGRDAAGRWLTGQAPAVKSPGRPALPAWFRSRAPEALQYLLDVATGVEPAEPKDRIKAAQCVVDRYYGKAPETINVEGGSPVLDLLVAMAKPVEPK